LLDVRRDLGVVLDESFERRLLVTVDAALNRVKKKIGSRKASRKKREREEGNMERSQLDDKKAKEMIERRTMWMTMMLSLSIPMQSIIWQWYSRSRTAFSKTVSRGEAS
jgi:hypothetical protein